MRGPLASLGSRWVTEMKLKLWQVDAFAAKPLEGNPAAIMPLERWLDAGLMQKIANENNLAETAFFVRIANGRYELRWFWLIFDRLDPELKSIAFETRSGTLNVERGRDGRHSMSLPSDPVAPFGEPAGLAAAIGAALGTEAPAELLKGRYLFAVWPKARDVRAITGAGDIGRVLRSVNLWGLIATAPGDEGYDFVSRFFAPDKGVPEDPVTGSAHCALTPYWARRLSKEKLRARQVSPRGGDVDCTDAGPRTILSGPCALYLTGEIEI